MGKSVRSLWLSLFVLTSISLPLLGGLNQWTTRGPDFPGIITAVVTSPLSEATVYASGPGGVFKSEDGGGRWVRVNQGLTEWSVRALTIAPDAPHTLYALTAFGRIFKTDDGAAQWRELSTPPPGRKFAMIALEGGVVLASAESGHGLRSADGGETWTASLGPCGPASRFKRAADGDVACSGFSFSAALSEDRGATWRKVEEPRQVSLMAFGPDGSIFAFSPEGTHKSVDGAKSFRRIAVPDASLGRIHDFHVSRSGVLFAAADHGAFAFRDDGWRRVEGAAVPVVAFADQRPGSERIFAASQNGVLTGLETDSAWRSASDGLANVFLSDVAISPYDPSLVFTVGVGRGFRSDSATGPWTLLDADFGSWIATTPASPNVVYAGNGSILKSSDAGETWSAIKLGSVSSLAVAHSDPSRLYAALVDSGMSRSTDGGESWAPIMNDMPWGYYGAFYGFYADITVDPVDPSVVFVSQEDGLYRTTNGGDSWLLSSESEARVDIDHQDPTIIYGAFPDNPLAFPRGLARSNDRGVTWTRIAPDNASIVDVAVDPSISGVVYASTEHRVYRSADYGATWSVLGDLEGPQINDLEIDSSGHYLVAATSAGVFEYEISAVDIAAVPGGAHDFAPLLAKAVADGAASRAGFVLPVVGVVQGGSGLFKTDVTVTNERPYAQQVLIAWLPRDGGAMSFFNLTVPGATGGSEYAIPNVMGRLGLTGVGTIVAIGVDASGAFDANASIAGSSRICAHNRDRNPVCETTAGARTDLLAAHQRASASGLRLDAAVRTNIGITNLDSRAHRYVVNAVGERNTATLEVTVPPFSLAQRALPSGDYGALTVEVTTDDASAPWLFFAVSIDNATAVATTKIGIP